MRVPNTTIYNSNQFQLTQLTENLTNANKVIATGKKINTLSDDPVALRQILDLKSKISEMGQYDRNITNAQGWLSMADTALNAVGDFITDAKKIAIDYSDGRVLSNTDKSLIDNQLDNIIKQIRDLANTRVNGQYIFAGTKTDSIAFEFDDPANPTKVNYTGNETNFFIKTSKDTDVVVGHIGTEIFSEEKIELNDGNNRINFSEDLGVTELTAIIPNGEYTKPELAVAIQGAMDTAGAGAGTYRVTYDKNAQTFTIETTLASLELYWQNGANASDSVASFVGFGNAGDDTGAVAYTSDSVDQFSVFKSLFDLKDLVQNDDIEGMKRIAKRLHTEYENMTAKIAEGVVAEQVHLETRQSVITDLTHNYKNRRGDLEDADVPTSIMDLQTKEFAYQVALNASARVLRMSLADFM